MHSVRSVGEALSALRSRSASTARALIACLPLPCAQVTDTTRRHLEADDGTADQDFEIETVSALDPLVVQFGQDRANKPNDTAPLREGPVPVSFYGHVPAITDIQQDWGNPGATVSFKLMK